MVADAGPPIFLMALGLVLWLAVTATLAGISIQTIGMILFFVGLLWLAFEMVQARSLGRREVVEEPVLYRERRFYTMLTIILIVLVLLLLFGGFGYSRRGRL
jgi:small-conductance mechanosensitive channel